MYNVTKNNLLICPLQITANDERKWKGWSACIQRNGNKGSKRHSYIWGGEGSDEDRKALNDKLYPQHMHTTYTH